MFALRDVSQNLANLETAANFFNFKKIVRRSIIKEQQQEGENTKNMSGANFATVFEIFFYILLFPFVYGIARVIGFITRQVISLIAHIYCRSILGDDYEAYKEEKTYEEFKDYFDEAEREREQERGAEKEREENRTSEGDTELMRDLRLFGLSLPFSKAELRKRYIEAVKQAHPDNGGSPEMAKAINAARDRLQRYAAG